MKTKKVQTLFLILGFVFAVFAAILSFQQDTYSDCTYDGGCGGGIDIAADGGAAGFAILSGLCFLSAGIIKKESQFELEIKDLKYKIFKNLMSIKNAEKQKVLIQSGTIDESKKIEKLKQIDLMISNYQTVHSELKSRLTIAIEEIPETKLNSA